jgi:uncharacterized protein YdiU (UPF0061 family)
MQCSEKLFRYTYNDNDINKWALQHLAGCLVQSLGDKDNDINKVLLGVLSKVLALGNATT